MEDETPNEDEMRALWNVLEELERRRRQDASAA
jgi:hypothetical protein